MLKSPTTDNKALNIPAAYAARLVFSLAGFLFVSAFAARGVYLAVFAVINRSLDLKHVPIYGFDAVLKVLSFLMLFHGLFGLYYIVSTKYHLTRLFREKAMFYLQIVSSFAAVFVIMAFIKPAEGTDASGGLFMAAVVAILGSFHFARGFFNACVSLGIGISRRAKSAVKAFSWAAAALSAMQLLFMFL